MRFNELRVKNFKSFHELNIALRKFNILIGANASGKSNFICVFKFLRDIVQHGLDNAISMQGGVEYLRNLTINRTESLSIEFSIVTNYRRMIRRSGINRRAGSIRLRFKEIIYNFCIGFKKRGAGFDISRDSLHLRYDVWERKEDDGKDQSLGLGETRIEVDGGKANFLISNPEGSQITDSDISSLFVGGLMDARDSAKILLLQTPISYYPVPWGSFLRDISIFDFDPKLPKKSTPITGKIDLEEDGCNLALVLKSIVESSDKERKLSNLLSDILPFVEKLDVEKFADKSLLFKLKEAYTKGKYLPASLISDGTINITALIIALYFSEKPLIVIEEPERNIHPHLISRIASMMKEASEKKQIFATTHNPQMIKHADIDDILLVSRDKDGFSTVIRPIERDDIKVFLENEMGIDELFIDNLLER